MKSDHENFLMTLLFENDTAWKVSKHGVFSGPYFPVLSPCTGKNGPEKTNHLDTFHIECKVRSIGTIFWVSYDVCYFQFEALHLQI